MDTARAERADAVVDGAAALPLVRAAAALRWSRPDLTATLAELALEAASDAGTWVAAAGWLLHGRATLGDGRDTASAILGGLDRWGEPVAALVDGPEGRRLRVELAGPARRIGETPVARALLMSVHGADDGDLELRADVLTELARCAVDDAPDTVDDALSAAEKAWRAAASTPGVASVTLLRSAWSRRAARPDAAVTEAVDGLTTLNAHGRRAGATASDHLAAALTAEWIAALVDAGRLDEARGEGLAAANRLVAAARASRQVAGLRLAIARVTAVDESPDAVLAALEPAAQVATDSDVPELESACRSMLGELHEAGGRLDAALAALRVAMAAERRDRERAAQLRARLAATAATWSGSRPGSGPATTGGVDPVPAAPSDTADGRRDRTPDVPQDVAGGPVVPGNGTGRRARRLAAEARGDGIGVGGASATVDGSLPDDGRPAYGTFRAVDDRRVVDAGHARDGAGSTVDASTASGPGSGSAPSAVPVASAGRTGARSTGGSGSLIGDALLRELAAGGRRAPDDLLSVDHDAAGHDRYSRDRPARGAGGATEDPLFGGLGTSRGPDLRHSSGAAPNGHARKPGLDDGSSHRTAIDPPTIDRHAVDPRPVDPHTVRWDRPASRPSPMDDTVVFGVGDSGQADAAARRSGSAHPAESHTVNGSSGNADGANGKHANGTHPNGAHSNGAHSNGTHRDDAHGDRAHRNGSPPHPPQDGTPTRDPATPGGTPDERNGARPARRDAAGRGPGRPPSTDTDGLGLAELLAGALAAYRDL